MEYFVVTSLVYFCVDALAVWSLNVQFGYAGIINFGWIVFQAVGAYVAATLSMGRSGTNFGQQYILGAHLPFPLPLLGGAVAGALLALVLGVILLARRLRPDFQAVIMLVVALIASQVVTYEVPIFNGSNGLSNIPQPLAGVLNLSSIGYQWVYLAWAAAVCVSVYIGVERLCRSSWGRALRAVREDDLLANTLGINVQLLRLGVFVIGGAIAGLSGGLLVEFAGAWSPAAWGYGETFVIFGALYIGGRANNRGALLGAFLVPVVFGEMSSFLPPIGYPGLVSSLSWILIGLLWLFCFYFWPRGIVPEGRWIVSRPGASAVALGTEGRSVPRGVDGRELE